MEPHEYRFNYVTVGLRHQYVISAAEEQVSFLRNIPGGDEMAVFAGLQKHPYNKPSPLKNAPNSSHATSLSPMHPQRCRVQRKLVLQLRQAVASMY